MSHFFKKNKNIIYKINLPYVNEKNLTNEEIEVYEYMKKLKKEQFEKIKRKCLSCDSEFIALGKYNRVCENCKKRLSFKL